MNWRKILKILGLSAFTLLFVLFAGGMLLDSTVELKTESTLDAPPKIVHALIADPTGIIRWWQGANAEFDHEGMDGMTMRPGEGPVTGPGATVLFELDDKLMEEWTLVSVTPPTEAVWDVDFQMFVVRRSLRLEPQGAEKTKVYWGDTGNFNNPLMRWFSLIPSDSLIENFQNALQLMNKRAKVDFSAWHETKARQNTAAKAKEEASAVKTTDGNSVSAPD